MLRGRGAFLFLLRWAVVFIAAAGLRFCSIVCFSASFAIHYFYSIERLRFYFPFLYFVSLSALFVCLLFAASLFFRCLFEVLFTVTFFCVNLILGVCVLSPRQLPSQGVFVGPKWFCGAGSTFVSFRFAASIRF